MGIIIHLEHFENFEVLKFQNKVYVWQLILQIQTYNEFKYNYKYFF